MRLRATALVLGLALSGCGQTGALYLPDEGLSSPVAIRPVGGAAAAGTAPATAPAEAPATAAPETPAKGDERKPAGAPAPAR
jgi:predicted small lipoprotein YifL